MSDWFGSQGPDSDFSDEWAAPRPAPPRPTPAPRQEAEPYTREELNGLDERIAQHNDALWLRRLLATARQAVEDGEALRRQRDAECERANRLAERIRRCRGLCMTEEGGGGRN